MGVFRQTEATTKIVVADFNFTANYADALIGAFLFV